jgi:hypothetical protein
MADNSAPASIDRNSVDISGRDVRSAPASQNGNTDAIPSPSTFLNNSLLPMKLQPKCHGTAFAGLGAWQ